MSNRLLSPPIDHTFDYTKNARTVKTKTRTYVLDNFLGCDIIRTNVPGVWM